jgi:hypothetical protein
VELGDENGGIVLNISEGGLALHAVSEVIGDELPKLRFQFSQSQSWIETKGRITWRSDSKKAAGVEFIDLPGDARKQIQEWIAFTSDSGGIEGKIQSRGRSTRDEVAMPPPEMLREMRSPEHATAVRGSENRNQHPFLTFEAPVLAEDENAGGVSNNVGSKSIVGHPERIRRLALPLLAALSLLSAFAFLGHMLRKPGNNGSGREVPAPTSVPARSSESSAVPPVDLGPSLATPGYVLQVGALAHEEDADKLAASLRRRKLPAFVFKRGDSRLYHVVIGPYNFADSAAATKDLEQQGLEVIRTEWKPEAE